MILAQFLAEPRRGELFSFDTPHAIFSWSTWQWSPISALDGQAEQPAQSQVSLEISLFVGKGYSTRLVYDERNAADPRYLY